MSSAATSSSSPSSSSANELATLLHRPLDFIDAQMVAAASGVSPSDAAAVSRFAESDWQVASRVEQLLGLQAPRTSPENKLAMVPSLNSLTSSSDIAHLRPNQLVRFRGMVQETFQPEYYLGLWTPLTAAAAGEEKASQQRIRTGKYRDVMELGVSGRDTSDSLDPSTGHSTTLERLSVNVVPIPGEGSWVGAAAQKLEVQSGQVAPAAPSAAQVNKSSPHKKRGAPEEEATPAAATADTMDESDNTEAASAAAASSAAPVKIDVPEPKKGRADAAGSAATVSASESGDALDHGLEVIVTCYDQLCSGPDAPKVTQCYEFIGILAINPDMTGSLDTADDWDMGSENWNPRRRRALRVHALVALPIHAGFPFIADPKVDSALFATQTQELRQVLSGVRASLLEFLTAVLAGDRLSAQLLLLFLLQRMHQRGIGHAGNAVVGKLTMNFVAPTVPQGVTQPALAEKVQQVLELLMPRTKRLEMNIDGLNQRLWQPKKNYETDALDSNLLHLSSPSLVILDETRLSAGQLTGVGVGNLQVLNRLLMSGQLEYDFQFQTINFDVDWAVLLISSGARTLLQQEGAHGIDLHVKMEPTNAHELYAPAAQTTGLSQPTAEQLDYWRVYLALARQNSFKIAPEMSKSIEDHFVSLRQTRPTTTSESTLHLLLNLARLNSLSHLESEMSSAERWQEVTQLFEQVHQRNTA